MNWLERYVSAVKSYLPGDSRDDVGEELMSTLNDKLEAKEAEGGREMPEDELKKWIGSQAHPLVLASGYQKHRGLVPPDLFPLYVHALKVAFLIILGLKVLGSAFYILSYQDFQITGLFYRLVGGLLEQGLLAFASITLLFYFLGDQLAKWEYFENWNVDNLPEVGHKWIAIPVGEKIFEVIAYVFLLGFVNSSYMGHWDFWWSDYLSLNPAFWGVIYWINAAIVLSLLQNLWIIVKPDWTSTKLVANIIIGFIGIGVLHLILNIDPLIIFDQASEPDAPNILPDVVTQTVKYSLYVIGSVYIYEIGRDLFRLYKLKS